jgi:xylose isomerase
LELLVPGGFEQGNASFFASLRVVSIPCEDNKYGWLAAMQGQGTN